jgi:hypothetical protein
MMQLILHAEYLLSIHECVIIPGLGGFVSHVSPAWFDERNSLWIPPQKELSFNPSLFHNDGLLLDSYSNTYSITYSEAFVMVEKAVLELKKELSTKNEVQFGRIGTFRYDENMALLFSPAEDLHYFSTGTYGLFPIKMIVLDDLKKAHIQYSTGKAPESKIVRMPEVHTHPVKSSDTIYIPLKKKFIYRVAAAAAIILVFLFLSTPIYVDTSHKTNYAKLLAPGFNAVNHYPDENESYFTNSTAPTQNLTEIVPVVSEKKAPTVNTPGTISDNQPVAIKSNAPSPISQSTASSGHSAAGPYYIVIGSFPTTKDAQQFVNYAKQVSGLSNAAILEKNGRYRVYADSFDNRAEANQYMKEFKAEHSRQHPNAWIYIDK